MINTFMPTSLSDFSFSNPVTEQALKLIVSGRLPFPAKSKSGILLHGTWGTGKTTLAKLLTSLITEGYGHDKFSISSEKLYEFISCEQGIRGDQLMPLINKWIDFQLPSALNATIVVLDEVDNLSPSAQRSLKGIMNREHFGVIMTTNYISRIDRGVLDRSYVLEMDCPPAVSVLPLLRRIAQDANWTDASDAELVSLAEKCSGSYRGYQTPIVLEAAARCGARCW